MAKEITVREAVRLTGYSRQQIYNILFAGRVPSHKRGSEHRIDKAALLKYMTSERGPKVA